MSTWATANIWAPYVPIITELHPLRIFKNHVVKIPSLLSST